MSKPLPRNFIFSLFIFISLVVATPLQAQVGFGGNSPNPSPNSVVIGAGPYRSGDAVSVKWHGSWWPAQVLQVGRKQWFIHYDGYGNNWDEWVGPGRIRPR